MQSASVSIVSIYATLLLALIHRILPYYGQLHMEFEYLPFVRFKYSETG
jgi:hypothetical protein